MKSGTHDHDETSDSAHGQPLTKESLQNLVAYMTGGYWDRGNQENAGGTFKEEMDGKYISENTQGVREYSYQILGIPEEQSKNIERSLKAWSNVADIKFTRVPDDAVSSDEKPNITFTGSQLSELQGRNKDAGFAWEGAEIIVPTDIDAEMPEKTEEELDPFHTSVDVQLEEREAVNTLVRKLAGRWG